MDPAAALHERSGSLHAVPIERRGGTGPVRAAT